MTSQFAVYAHGEIYFLLLFADTDLRIPIIRTLEFIGDTRRDDGTAAVLFRDLDHDAKSKQLVFAASEAKEVVVNAFELMERLRRSFMIDGARIVHDSPRGDRER